MPCNSLEPAVAGLFPTSLSPRRATIRLPGPPQPLADENLAGAPKKRSRGRTGKPPTRGRWPQKPSLPEDHPARDIRPTTGKLGEAAPLIPGKTLPAEAGGQTYNDESAGLTEMQAATQNAPTTGPTSTLVASRDSFALIGLEPSGSPCGNYMSGGGTPPATP